MRQTRRLTFEEFEKIGREINSATAGLTKESLEKRRDYLLDQADSTQDTHDRALYLVWAGNIDTEIRKRFPG